MADTDDDHEASETKVDAREATRNLASAEDGKAKNLNARTSLLDKARLKLRSGWKNDAGVLNQYFQSCVANWKIYKGERKPKQVMKLQVIYRQATQGDCVSAPPQNMKSVNGLKWQAWVALKGMPQEMAKRRFITYLAEINAALIDVMPDEKPPDGFCKDVHGRTICAKCNTVAGCGRPLLDQYKIDMRDQLFDSNELHEPQELRKWIRNGLDNQQCVWGVHKAVPSADIKQFHVWFSKDENGGYQPYEPTSVYSIVRDLLTYHYEIAYDMSINNTAYFAEVINAQSIKVGKLKSIYEELSGEKYVFEAPCKFNTPLCNELRSAQNGRNHTHPFDLMGPTAVDVNDYEASIALRQQCQKLGLSATTGVVENVQQRCLIYRTRIADYFKGLKIAAEATKRLDARIEAHQDEKTQIKTLSSNMIIRQASDACHSMKIQHVLTLIRRGCNPNFQTNRGLTAMITAVLTQAPTELIEELVQRKSNINSVNMYGQTPLMMSCRLKDTKMIHALMRLGCSALQDGGRAGGGLTAMHWCAIHGAEEEAKIILEYVKEGGGDSLRLARVLDFQSQNGDTPMMLAARIRNGLMCRVLSSLGANPNVRNSQNRNAQNIARTAGWTELADWLEKKVGAGVAKLETYSDLQYDKMVRYGKIRMEENIEEFGRIYLSLVHDSTTTSPLGPPSIAITAVEDVGKRAHDAQLLLADRHQLYINRKDEVGREIIVDDPEKKQLLAKLDELLSENMLAGIKKGAAAPNTEALQKPLPWTPLMCATCLNNIRMIKLFVRDGADPNHPNMQGTTPLMQAAQLQNLDALVELLILGADISKCDNFGFTALAYATSLPIPQYMAREATYTMLDGDTEGPKKRDSAAILKLALKNGLGAIRDHVASDAEEASRQAVENHFRFMRLLESYGLSRLQTVKQLVGALDTADWRIGKDTHQKIVAQEFSETASERDERERVEAHRAEMAEHVVKVDDEEVLRCPICTLVVPCPHFFKASILKKFIEDNKPEDEGTGTTGSALQDMLNAATMRKNFAAANKERMRMKVLTEVGIADRNTDRSIAFNNKYRARERELDRLASERKAKAEKVIQDALDAEDEADRGLGWSMLTDKETGKIYYEHAHTQIRWDAVPDGQGQTYFHNPATNETLWDVPGLAEWIVQDTAAKVKAEAEEAAEAEKKRIKEEKRAAREAKKQGGKAKNKSGKTAVELAKEAAEKEKKEKAAQDRIAEKIFTQRRLDRANEKAGEVDELGGDDQPVFVEDDGMNGMSNQKKKKRKNDYDDAWTPKSILKKDTTADPERAFRLSFRFIEGDIDPTVEVRKDWLAIEDGSATTPTKDTAEGQDVRDMAVTAGEESQEVTPSSPTEVTTKGEGLPLKGIVADKPKVDDTGNAVKGAIAAEVKQANALDTAMNGGKGDVKIVDPDEERELTKDEKFRLRKGVNPYPMEKRRLFSFTKEPISAVDHLIVNEPKLSRKELKKVLRENTVKSSVLSALDANSATSVQRSRSAETKRRTSAPKALLRGEGKVQISGFVFVALSNSELRAPIDKVELPLEMWSAMVEHIREKFASEWTQRLVLRSMVSPNSLKVTTARCWACKIGFVRTKAAHDGSENNLCFSCIVRKELYERAQQVFPRSFRRKASSQWPFRKTAEDDDDDIVFGGSDPITPIHKNNTLDHNSPVHSQRLAELDVRETAFDLSRERKPFALSSSLSVGFPTGFDEGSIDSLGSLAIGSMNMSVDDKGMLQQVTLGSGHNILLENSMESLPTSLSHVSVPSVFSNDTADMPDNNKAREKIPGELSLIPFLLAKGQFEEVDRTVRVAVGKRTVNEGEGAVFLVNALALQADMYKMMGLYALALGVYLEAFDLTVSILGFNSNKALEAMTWVSSCLLKMRCPKESKDWTSNVCRFLETEALSHNMYSQSKVLLDADHAMRKKLVKNELIWKNMIMPVLAEREADSLWNHPSRNFKWILFKYCGYPAVYRIYANVDGYSVVARQAFEAHCKALDPERLGKYARFVSMCFRLRTVNNTDTYRHIVQELVQKYLGASLVNTCEIAKVFRKITPEDQIKEVSGFLQFGLSITVDVFDEILFHSLKVLGNSGEFRFFYMRDGGAGLRDKRPDDTLQCFHALATKIQVPMRIKLARLKIKRILKENAEEAARQLAEFNDANGIREETPEEIKQRKKEEKKAEKRRKMQELLDAGLSIDDDF